MRWVVVLFGCVGPLWAQAPDTIKPAKKPWPRQLIGAWAKPVEERDGADTVVLHFRADGYYDKFVIRMQESFDGPKVSTIDTLRRELPWQARHIPDGEHASAHDEICLMWRGDISCGWYRLLQGHLYVGGAEFRRRSRATP